MARSVIGALRVTLGLDSAQFETGLKRASKSTRTFETAAANLTGVVRGMASAFGIVSLGATARGFLSLADQSKNLTSQLKLATAQTGSFAKAQEDVRRIAEQTRTGLADTGALYASFARSAGELGISQEQVARITETVNKAFLVSGASAGDAGNAIRQLSQAFASGVLRGDEFNSIMENAPRLAKLLADSLGVPVGSLRAMAEEGELTADKLVRALSDKKFLAGLDAEAREMPVTFDQAMTQIHNSAITTFGGFDKGGGFSTALANFIMEGTTGFADLEQGAVEMGIQVRASIEGLASAFDPVFDAAERFFARMESGMGEISFSIGRELRDVDRLTEWLSGGESGAEQWINRNLWGIESGRTNFEGRYREGRDRGDRMRRNEMAEQDAASLVGRYFDRWGNPVQRQSARARPPARSGGGGRSGGSGSSADAQRRRADAEAERAADALRRFTDDLSREQADLAEATARLTGNTSALADAEIAKIEADRAVREREIQDRERISDAQKQQLIDLNNQNATVQKQAVRQREIEAQIEKTTRIKTDDLSLQIELLQLSSDLARTVKERRDIELQILDKVWEEERLRLEGIKATSAVITADYAYADNRLKMIDELKSRDKSRVLRQTQGPMESYLEGLPRTADEAREAIERVQVDGVSSLIDGLASAELSVKGLGDVFKSVANQIIQDLIRIQLQKLFVNSIGGALGLGGGLSLGGGGGNAFAAAGSYDWSAIPGFATGGSFKVGGSSTVGDKNLVAFRANAGEMVDIRRPGNDNGGGAGTTINYIGPGAEEFWREVDGRANARATTAVVRERQTDVRKQKSKLGRSGR